MKQGATKLNTFDQQAVHSRSKIDINSLQCIDDLNLNKTVTGNNQKPTEEINIRDSSPTMKSSKD